MKKYIVLKTFADKNDLAKRYHAGDELPASLGEDRLADIANRGLAREEDVEAEAEAGNGKGKGGNGGDNAGAANTATDTGSTANTVKK